VGATALTLLDVFIGGLTRGGDPGTTKTRVLLADSDASRLGLTVNPLQCGKSVVLSKFATDLGILDVCSVAKDLRTYTLGGEVVGHALKLARAGLEVLYDEDFKKISSCPWASQLSAYKQMCSWPMSDFVKNAKYWTAYPMARFLHNPLPPTPPQSYNPSQRSAAGALLYSGPIKRYLKNRLVSFNRTNLHLFGGLLQGVKRGAEVVPESFVYETMKNHRAALTRKNPASSADLPIMTDYFERFFKNFKSSHPKVFEPSRSAAFGATRSSGGAAQLIRDRYLAYPPEEYDAPTSRSTSKISRATMRALEPEVLLDMYEHRPGEVREIRAPPGLSSYPELFQLTAESRASTSFQARMRAAENLLGCRIFSKEALTTGQVMVSAVLEPLKCRLITKGDAMPYYYSKFYQKQLWRHLNIFPQFALTGRPVREEDLYDLVRRADTLGLDFPDWVSGDYSAATDKLKIDYTKAAFEASLKKSRLGEEEKGFLRAVLYEQELHYPKKYEEKGGLDPVRQETGQLMGSTLSFPILCCVNLVCYWRTLESYLGHRVALRDLPVLVNGDDILFKTNPVFYEAWKKNISEAGFELSLGKNYVHPRFCMINSEGFLWSNDRVRPVGYLNVGLLTGQSKLGGARAALSVSSIWDYYNEVIDGANDPVRAHRRFIHYNKAQVESYTQKGMYNLFAHQALGGLGFKLVPELYDLNHFTPFQAKFGRFLEGLTSQSFTGEFSRVPPFRGIVHEAKAPRVVQRHIYHQGSFHLEDPFKPLASNERRVQSSTICLRNAVLASVYASPEKPVLVIRPPDRVILRAFRSGAFNPLRAKRLTSFSGDWVETVLQVS